MDPLTAFSLAGTIIQFVDYGTKLLLGANELYKTASGALAANEQLELITSDLHSVLLRLGAFSTTSAGKTTLPSEDEGKLEISFRKICDEAAAVAKELMEHLEKLKVDDSAKGHRRVWASLSKAIESAWTRREREELTKKLNGLKEALETRVLFSFRANFDLFTVQVSERFDSLDKQTQTIVSALVEDRKFAANRFSHNALEQTSTLAHLLGRLQLNNTEEHRKTRAMIANVGNREIVSSIEVLDVSYDEEARLRKLVNDKILVSLYFQSMTERYEEVPDAYQDTFRWIFDEPTEQQAPWANFLAWLCHGDGIYWIKGKAGSGKSTLMKSIYDDPRLRQNLDTWASGRQLHIASFFFWNSGTQYQKSQEGLIRALLFQVLKEEPDLIPIVLPLQWARTYSGLVSGAKSGLVNEPWKLRSLKNGFNLLVKQTLLPIKLCLFVDGLDEFDGDHNEMAEIFKGVTSPYVKVCTSSRPWIDFEESFEGCPCLRLQDLTKKDIKQYVGGTLANSASYRRLSARDSTSTTAFVQEIVETADGVFLWVFLVVKSLLNGMRNRDSVEDLQKRLRRLPKELEPLYNHLLELIQPEYLEWASRAFQVFQTSQDYQLKKELWRRPNVDEPPPLSILQLHLALDEGLAIEAVDTWTIEMVRQRCEDATVHLTVRCAGLLEVIYGDHLTLYSKVQFLHRTAYDFLRKPAVWADILSRTSVTKFNPDVSLLKSYVLQLKFTFVCPGNAISDTPIRTIAYHALIHASCAESQTLKAPKDILDNLDYLMDDYIPQTEYWADIWGESRVRGFAPVSCFLPVAVMYGLVTYVEFEGRGWRAGGKSFPSSTVPLLHYAIPRECTRRHCPPPRPAMVQLLLNAEEDPNVAYEYQSSWQQGLSYARGQQVRGDVWSEKLQVFQILASMLKAGADPHVHIQINEYMYSVETLLHDVKNDRKFLFSNDYPVEIVNLSNAVEEALQNNGGIQNSGVQNTTRYQDDLQKSKRKQLSSWIKRLGS